MKSFITLLSISLFFIAAQALCMDPSSFSAYPGLATRQASQDRSPQGYVGQDGERKQEQAALDAQQFAKEQESKKESALANATTHDQALAEQLQQEDAQILAQDTDADNHIRKWFIEQGRDKDGNTLEKLSTLPLPILRQVIEFHYADPEKLKFIAQNVESLLPSSIYCDHNPWIYFASIFHHIDKIHKKFSEKPLPTMKNWPVAYKYHNEGIANRWRVTEEFMELGSYPTKFESLERGFVAYRFKDGILYKIPASELNALSKLSLKQLHYLKDLFTTRKDALEVWATSHAGQELTNLDDFALAETINLSPEQLTIHQGMPVHIRTTLEQNYRFDHIENQDAGGHQ